MRRHGIHRRSHRRPPRPFGESPHVGTCSLTSSHDVLLVPYGIGDANIGFATVAIGDLLTAMD